MAAKKKLSFEEQLAALEGLISGLESGGLSLEESMKRYEEGVRLAESLEKELQSATQRITVLRKNAAGQDEEVSLEEDMP